MCIRSEDALYLSEYGSSFPTGKVADPKIQPCASYLAGSE